MAEPLIPDSVMMVAEVEVVLVVVVVFKDEALPIEDHYCTY